MVLQHRKKQQPLLPHQHLLVHQPRRRVVQRLWPPQPQAPESGLPLTLVEVGQQHGEEVGVEQESQCASQDAPGDSLQ